MANLGKKITNNQKNKNTPYHCILHDSACMCLAKLIFKPLPSQATSNSSIFFATFPCNFYNRPTNILQTNTLQPNLFLTNYFLYAFGIRLLSVRRRTKTRVKLSTAKNRDEPNQTHHPTINSCNFFISFSTFTNVKYMCFLFFL